MGMYDELAVDCPKCSEKVYFQSKAGDCSLKIYETYNVPAAIALDLENCTETCTSCNFEVGLKVQTIVHVTPY